MIVFFIISTKDWRTGHRVWNYWDVKEEDAAIKKRRVDKSVSSLWSFMQLTGLWHQSLDFGPAHSSPSPSSYFSLLCFIYPPWFTWNWCASPLIVVITPVLLQCNAMHYAQQTHKSVDRGQGQIAIQRPLDACCETLILSFVKGWRQWLVCTLTIYHGWFKINVPQWRQELKNSACVVPVFIKIDHLCINILRVDLPYGDVSPCCDSKLLLLTESVMLATVVFL